MSWSFWRSDIESRVESLEHSQEQLRYPRLRKHGLTAFKVTTFYKWCYAVHAYEVELLLQRIEELEENQTKGKDK